MGHETRRIYRLLCAAFFTFFLSWSFSFALFPIWLNQAIGLKGESTGIIFSINAITAMFIMPLYGYTQDKLGLRKGLLLLVASMLLLVGPFFIFIYGPLLAENLILAATIGGVFFGIVFGAGVGALETYVERVSRIAGFEFGKARMWGSLGGAASSFFAGHLFNISPNINFWLASGCGIVFLLLVSLVHPADPPHQQEAFKTKAHKLHLIDVARLFASGRFWALATFVMGVSCIYSVYDQQFSIYYSSLFTSRDVGNRMFGYLHSLQVFLEAGGMFLAPLLVNRIGAKQGLVLSGVIMSFRMIGSGFSDGPIEISAMKLLHSIELPIMLISMFKYISATFDARLSATLYLVGFQFMSQVTASTLSLIAGRMYDDYGFSTSYKILGSVVAVFVVISYFILSDDRKNIAASGARKADMDHGGSLHNPA
ncbi:MFS transporter [Sphingomonas oleivorans]|uniref:MFS transporter n=1 Tax=Sphingomonas oleivorans TaxID=1735121 RepID=A0A2T5FTS2_9SPHN|nr:oligosaccharide MFS transporter [Sphingomonas oleivorans]PTQ07456.1 MFS transporter [Sphingomonas oleivorans]